MSEKKRLKMITPFKGWDIDKVVNVEAEQAEWLVSRKYAVPFSQNDQKAEKAAEQAAKRAAAEAEKKLIAGISAAGSVEELRSLVADAEKRKKVCEAFEEKLQEFKAAEEKEMKDLIEQINAAKSVEALDDLVEEKETREPVMDAYNQKHDELAANVENATGATGEEDNES